MLRFVDMVLANLIGLFLIHTLPGEKTLLYLYYH